MVYTDVALSQLLTGRTEETTLNLTIAVVPTKIQTEQLPNTSLQHYLQTNMFSAWCHKKNYFPFCSFNLNITTDFRIQDTFKLLFSSAAMTVRSLLLQI